MAAQGWPTLGALRGRVIFSLLDSGEHRDSYTAAAPNLAGRLMFVASSSPADPFAAMFKVNDARQEADRVRELVTDGFIVTSNVDGASGDATDNADKLAGMDNDQRVDFLGDVTEQIMDDLVKLKPGLEQASDLAIKGLVEFIVEPEIREMVEGIWPAVEYHP